jgi:hypothetical protein
MPHRMPGISRLAEDSLASKEGLLHGVSLFVVGCAALITRDLSTEIRS